MPSFCCSVRISRQHLLAQLRVEIRQRLVHQADLRLGDDRAAERDALLLAARELRRLALEQLAQAEQAGDARQARCVTGPRFLAHLHAEQDVVAHAQVRKQRVRLEHHGDAPLGGRHVRDVALVDQDAPFGRHVEPGDHAQGGRLAAARRAEQHDQLAARRGEGDAVDGPGRAVVLGYGFEAEGAHAQRRSVDAARRPSQRYKSLATGARRASAVTLFFSARRAGGPRARSGRRRATGTASGSARRWPCGTPPPARWSAPCP